MGGGGGAGKGGGGKTACRAAITRGGRTGGAAHEERRQAGPRDAGALERAGRAGFFRRACPHGCVRSAVAAAGLSVTALYYRRDHYPAFAERWRAVEAAAAERLPGLLRAASIASLDPDVAGEGLPLVNVDQAIAISRLKGPGPGPGTAAAGQSGALRGGMLLRKPALSVEEAREDLARKLKLLGERRKRERLAQGWTRTQEGQMVPPGWIYVGPGDQEGDGEDGDGRARLSPAPGKITGFAFRALSGVRG